MGKINKQLLSEMPHETVATIIVPDYLEPAPSSGFPLTIAVTGVHAGCNGLKYEGSNDCD